MAQPLLTVRKFIYAAARVAQANSGLMTQALSIFMARVL
jgi:hypothetical protein